MRLTRGICLLLVAAAAVAGCGDNGKEHSASDPDVSSLDSGNFPTEPRDLSTTRSPKAGPYLEAIRIANATPLVVEVDPKLSYQRFTYRSDRRSTPDSPPTLYSVSEDARFAEMAEGFIAGWETNGERRAVPALGRNAVLYALRFGTADQARTAGTRIAQRQAADFPGTSVTIEGFPQAKAKWSTDKRYLDTWLAQDTMLLGVHIEDPVSEPVDTEPLVEFTRTALTAQVDALRAYQPTPVSELDSLPVDIDGLLGRTLPLEEKHQPRNRFDVSWVAPAHAALHAEGRPGRVAAAFTDAGVDLVASAGARVYRARDEDGAIRLMTALAELESDTYKPAPSPSGMPGARCYELRDPKGSTASYPPICYLVFDRYVGRVQGTNAQELHQQTAAQYKLLAHDD